MARGAITVKIDGQYDNKDIDRAIRDLSRLKDQSGAAKEPMNGLTGAMKGLAAAAGAALAIGAVVDFMRDAAVAAVDDEKSMVALATAMDNVGLSSKNAAAEDLINSLVRTTGVADDELRPALQRLITSTGDLGKAQSLLNLALDISAAGYGTVEQAAKALSKASTGQVSALTRLGVPLDSNIVKTKDFDGAVESLSTRFEGQAVAAADTYGGRLKILSEGAGELQESFGKGLLDGFFESMAGDIGSASDQLFIMQGRAESVGKAIGGIGGSFFGWIDDFLLGSMKLADAVADIQAAYELLEINVQDFWGEITDEEAEAARQALELADAQREAAMKAFALGEASAAAAPEVSGVGVAAEDTADAIDEIKESVLSLTAALNASQSLDDFKKSLADLDTTLDGNKRSFRGMGDAAKENRDALRSALGDAATIAEKWVEDGKISADQYEAAYKGLSKKVVNQFVRDGFKRDDIEAFMGAEGIWTGPAKAKLTAAEKAALRTAYSGFKGVGSNSAKGFADGLLANGGVVKAAAVAVAHQGINAANKALGIESPSRVFMEIGRQTIAGFVEGMASKDAEVREQARKSMTQAVSEVIADTRGQLKSALADAQAAFADFQRGVSESIMGGIDFGQAAPEFDEAGNRVGSSFLEGLRQQAAQAVNFATQVKTLIQQGLSQEALQQVLAAGVQAGSAIATELIAGGTTAINETNALVSSTQAAADKVGLQAAQKWYGAGVQSAKDTISGFNEQMKPGGDGYDRLMNRMDRLAAAMNRTARITVVVDEVAGAKVKVDGARAKGGPVWPGGAFIVGERGPELFMPEVKGQILPSASMPSAGGGASISGGNTYSITVQAGVGDPRQIGQQVVEYIKKFEQTNGANWRAA